MLSKDLGVTLLVSLYTSRGIVFAADSSITTNRGGKTSRLRKQEKFLCTKRLGVNGGIVGYFGLAQVDDEPMDQWLRTALDKWHGSSEVADLGIYLCDRLNADVPPAHRTRVPSGFHIGAFESRGGISVPVFHFVWNYRTLDVNSGIYLDLGMYEQSEHFPRNHDDWKSVGPAQMKASMRQWERSYGLPFWFRNGQLAFSARVWQGLTLAIGDVTQNLGGSGFALPDDLQRWEDLADTLVRTNGRLYSLLGTRGAPAIEGPYRKTSIPWP